MTVGTDLFEQRLARHHDELRWLYMELYDNGDMFAELCDQMHRFYEERKPDLKKLDAGREADPEWFRGNDMLGMMLYIDCFAGNIRGVKDKLDYLQCELHTSDAVSGFAGRTFRRRLCSRGFSKGEAAAWDNGGAGGSVGGVPQAEHKSVHGLCDEPYVGGTRMGEAGAPGRGRIYEPVFLL